MAKYESKVKYVNAPVEKVYATLSDLEHFRPIIEGAADNPMVRQKMEEAGQDPSVLERLKDINITSDRVSITAPMVGEIAMAIVEREQDKCVKLQTEQSPVEANLWVQVLPTSEITLPTGEQGCRLKLTLKADLNPMVKMMIGSKLAEGIDKFADMLAMLPYGMM